MVEDQDLSEDLADEVERLVKERDLVKARQRIHSYLGTHEPYTYADFKERRAAQDLLEKFLSEHGDSPDLKEEDRRTLSMLEDLGSFVEVRDLVDRCLDNHRLKDVDTALNQAKLLASSANQEHDALVRLGSLHRKLGNLATAKQHYRKALKAERTAVARTGLAGVLRPEFWASGQSQAYRNRLQEALKLLEEAVEIDPSNEHAQRCLEGVRRDLRG